MWLSRIKLRNFRNYESAEVNLAAGFNIITGPNGAGKTNLLEAAQYVLCGRSFRTSREQEMTRQGSAFLRLEAEYESDGFTHMRAVSLASGGPVNVEAGGGPRWVDPGMVLCFSPDDLQLIKGAPASRRRFLDESISRLRPAHHRLALEYQKVLSQRNSFLKRARAGYVSPGDILPWDRQLVAMALAIHAARREHCRRLAPFFQEAWSGITGEETAVAIEYESQLTRLAGRPDAEGQLLMVLADTRENDMQGAATGTGTHRDEVHFLRAGEPLRQFGSQGEQRAAVLALLLAARGMACAEGSPPPVLLLDDVMSELDPDRRRLLMESLAGGQTVITAADSSLFSAEELDGAAVFEVGRGGIMAGRETSGV